MISPILIVMILVPILIIIGAIHAAIHDAMESASQAKSERNRDKAQQAEYDDVVENARKIMGEVLGPESFPLREDLDEARRIAINDTYRTTTEMVRRAAAELARKPISFPANYYARSSFPDPGRDIFSNPDMERRRRIAWDLPLKEDAPSHTFVRNDAPFNAFVRDDEDDYDDDDGEEDDYDYDDDE